MLRYRATLPLGRLRCVGVLSRHFVARFLSTFAASVVILTLAILTVETLTDLHVAVGENGDWSDLFSLTSLRISAYYLPYLVPLGAFVAAFVRFGGAARRSEIVAAKAGGISPLDLALPVFAAGLGLGLASLAANELLSVPSRAALQQIERGDRGALSFRQGAFWHADGAYLFRVESADEGARVLHGVTVFERDPRGRLIRRVRAARAEFVGNDRLAMSDAEMLSLDPEHPAAEGVREAHAVIELELGNRGTLLEANPDLLLLRDLLVYADGKTAGSAQALQARSLIHERLTNPLATLPFVILATALGLRVERSRSLARSALPGVLAVLAFLLVRHYAGMLSRQGVWPATMGAWGSLALFAVAAADQLRRVPR